MSLPILYLDSDIVAINKPSGLLVHRTALDKTATEFAMQKLRDQIGQEVFPVHRLDRATSGALIFALSKTLAAKICVEFAKSQIEKKYLAVVRGIVSEPVLVDHPIKEELDKMTDRKAKSDKAAQPAVTYISPIATCELAVKVDRYPTSRYSLIQVQPKTGRKHQIRKHLHHLHHPIIGDVNYGSGPHNRFFQKNFNTRRLLLACTEISLTHPTTKNRITIKAPLSEDFSAVLGKLGWGNFSE